MAEVNSPKIEFDKKGSTSRFNLDENGRVRTSDKSSGRPDALITKSDPTGFIPEELEYREYTFTANELPSFKTFRIKFLMTSTNQAFVPRLTSLKVIATA